VGPRGRRAQVLGGDRVFVYLRLDAGFDPAQDIAVAALEAAGQPTVRIALADAYDVGQELFRWEFAAAVAGSILGINPFDQPDVEASKLEARRLIPHPRSCVHVRGRQAGAGARRFRDPGAARPPHAPRSPRGRR
jgi:hypothetical protein